jgi:hypothetical protein
LSDLIGAAGFCATAVADFEDCEVIVVGFLLIGMKQYSFWAGGLEHLVKGGLGHPQQFPEAQSRNVAALCGVVARISGQTEHGPRFRDLVHEAMVLIARVHFCHDFLL